MVTHVIETERLHLRPLTEGDAAAFHAIWGDPEVIWWGAHADVGQTLRFLKEIRERVAGQPGYGWFAVEQRLDARLVGDVVLQPAPWDPEVAELGWHMAKAAQGQGYATEAARAVVDHAVAAGIDHFEAIIVPDNEPSRGVARKLGMTISGSLDRAGLLHDLWVLDIG